MCHNINKIVSTFKEVIIPQNWNVYWRSYNTLFNYVIQNDTTKCLEVQREKSFPVHRMGTAPSIWQCLQMIESH